MNLPAGVMILFSVLVPSRMWYAPDVPLTVQNNSNTAVTLALTDFTGKVLDLQAPGDRASYATPAARDAAAEAAVRLEPGKQANLRPIFPDLGRRGTYVLYAVPQGKALPEFVGTPLVIEVRGDPRPNNPNPAEVLVTRVEPLRYLSLETDLGTITVAMLYDGAPHTVATILQLAGEGFYDGLLFHRIVPGFVAQTGDPLGDSRGGPGFHIDAEFNDYRHVEGMLSMARAADPLEPELAPRCEFANSAGSQFFICLGKLERLDGHYTVFGKVMGGMDVLQKLGAEKLADPKTGRPAKPPVIRKANVKVVTPRDNPYGDLTTLRSGEGTATTRPTAQGTGNSAPNLQQSR